MERLTDKVRNYDGTATSKQSLIVEEGLRAGTPSDYCSKIVTKLADYEDAEEQGLLLKLPCAIGTTVYQITKTLSYGEIGDPAEVNYKISEVKFNLCMIDFINKIVFLTKEEAGQALEQMEGE